jgi:hypothetical protein
MFPCGTSNGYRSRSRFSLEISCPAPCSFKWIAAAAPSWSQYRAGVSRTSVETKFPNSPSHYPHPTGESFRQTEPPPQNAPAGSGIYAAPSVAATALPSLSHPLSLQPLSTAPPPGSAQSQGMFPPKRGTLSLIFTSLILRLLTEIF